MKRLWYTFWPALLVLAVVIWFYAQARIFAPGDILWGFYGSLCLTAVEVGVGFVIHDSACVLYNRWKKYPK